MTYPWLEAVDAEFSERFESDRLPHALLLSGPRDTGKVALATGFIASLMCLENQHPACGSCRSCQLLKSGAHPDRHIVTFEENPKTGELRKELVIDQIRKLISSLYLTNTFSQRKAALIHPVEAMNRHTVNALLKTLEEPPGETVLILVSDDPARLPATIRSRCQNLQVRPPGFANALEWLCDTGGTSEPDAEAALRAAAGNPLKALSMLRDGSTDQYRLVALTLDEVRMGTRNPGAALAALAEVEPESLWSWISLLAAWELKSAIADPTAAKPLSMLQSTADKNRKLVPTPVRKDFLLQDWLIQWSRLGAKGT
jgi:DNA polymerase-3 subunit delta'